MSDQTLKATRQQSLITLLSQSDWLTTEVLAEKLSVSKETIRRDLKSLQQQGKLLRQHGRARLIHPDSRDSGEPFGARLKSHYADKADIARHALGWISEGSDHRPRRQLNLLSSGAPVAGHRPHRIYQQPACLPRDGKARADHAYLLRRNA